MKCAYCGSELKEGANFCTICGKAVSEEQKQSAASPERQTASAGDGALRGYMSYTSGEYRTTGNSAPAADASASYAPVTDAADRNNEWAAWVSIVCAVLALRGVVITLPGILLGIAAIIFGSISCKSSMKVVAICGIVLGAIAIAGAFGMALLWRWIFDLAGDFMFDPPFYW